ncbi:MAG: hypothetical protein IT453_05860 [Planctomycetes bacterium]|jgi:hypothetical protein|nr:hypothetical protein [Planctomycetota bacterium]
MSPPAKDPVPDSPRNHSVRAPDPRRAGWSRIAIPGGELRVDNEWFDRLHELGLVDPERWRAEDLSGVTVERKPDLWVRCIPGKDAALFARYRRGSRRTDWLDDLLHGRKPLSAAAREERTRRLLSKVGIAAPHIVLVGEVRSRVRIERESFLVTREAIDFEPLARTAWNGLAPQLRALLGGFEGPAHPAPEAFSR